MKKKLFVVLVASLLVTGCVKTPKLESGEEILAEIDGKQYTANDLYEKMKDSYGTSALIDLVDRFIISQELSDTTSEEAQAKSYIAQMKSYYESSGYTWSEVLANNGFTEDSLLEYYALNYEKETVAKKYYESIITDKEIEKYYKDEIIGDITAKQILIVPETNTDMTDEEKEEANTKAYNKALEVIEKLNNGEDFSELAKEYSDDDSASIGGTLAPFNKQSNYPTEFIEQAIKLDVDNYSKTPIKSSYGYHIIYIVSKDEKPSLDDVKDSIISTLAEEKMEDNENYLNTAWKGLREKYNLNIYDTIVKEHYDQTMSQY
ncbi:MAG: peptidylprolyl isomerase [Bacilli bacterium]|nr:peptidylprolyl isomerase [Bacilli bacterium]